MEKLLIELQKKGIVNKHKKGYYVNYQGEKQFIGPDSDTALQKLNDIGIEDIISDFQNSSPTSSEAALSQKESSAQKLATDKSIVIPANVKESTSDDPYAIYENILGTIYDINPTMSEASALDVKVFDPVSKTYIDSRLVQHRAIKRLNREFAWVRDKAKRKSGEDYVSNSYTVIKKTDHLVTIDGKKVMLIETGSDDTPNEDFWTVGNLVLAAAKLDQMVRKRLTTVVKRKIANRKEKSARNEFSKTQAMKSDFDEILASLEKEVNRDISKVRSNLSDTQNIQANAKAVDTKIELEKISRLVENDPVDALTALNSLNNLDGF